MVRTQASTQPGQLAQWTVTAWTTSGIVSGATIAVQATPAGGSTPAFTSGCGPDDGTASCGLAEIGPWPGRRQLQVQLTVPQDTAVGSSVSLTAAVSAAELTQDVTAATDVAVSAPPASASPTPTSTAPASTAPASASPTTTKKAIRPAKSPTASPAVSNPVPGADPTSTELGASGLPGIATVGGASSVLSPGGNAASLFPTLSPAPTTPSPAAPSAAASLFPSGPSTAGGAVNPDTTPLANTSALPEGTSAIGVQLVGLISLAVAFVLAVTRLTLRRRTRKALAGQAKPATAAKQPADAEPGTDGK